MKWDAEKYDSVKAPQVDAGRELIEMANVCDTDSILDIGCGTGKLTIELARLASKGYIVGIDPSEEMLEKYKRTSKGVLGRGKDISFGWS
jgi:ubiquinone/menaquinone biosynthesis C-methylase UbiE